MSRISQHNDALLLAEIGDRLAAARLARNLTQASLARDAGVAKRTVERMEAGHSAQLTSFIRVLRKLDLLDGLEALLPPARPEPMELLRGGGKAPQRASGGRGGGSTPAEPWTWAAGATDDADADDATATGDADNP